MVLGQRKKVRKAQIAKAAPRATAAPSAAARSLALGVNIAVVLAEVADQSGGVSLAMRPS